VRILLQRVRTVYVVLRVGNYNPFEDHGGDHH